MPNPRVWRGSQGGLTRWGSPTSTLERWDPQPPAPVVCGLFGPIRRVQGWSRAAATDRSPCRASDPSWFVPKALQGEPQTLLRPGGAAPIAAESLLLCPLPSQSPQHRAGAHRGARRMILIGLRCPKEPMLGDSPGAGKRRSSGRKEGARSRCCSFPRHFLNS